MKHIGTFKAQFFKFLSFDPNTIYQIVVFDDRLLFLKVGSALNQLPQALLHLPIGPVGLKTVGAGGIADPNTLQAALATDQANYQLAKPDVSSIGIRKKHWAAKDGALNLVSRTKGKQFFRLLDADSAAAAEAVLKQVFGTAMKVD